MKTGMLDIVSPAGNLRIAERDGKICELSFLQGECAFFEGTPLLKEAARQIEQYFAKERRAFDLPLAMEGTAFQKMVWEALLEIPYGKTATYGDIARKIMRPMAFRAVGMACHGNPIAIIVPCHRVIGANGKLTGYAEGLDIKKTLLQLETEGTA